MIETPQLTETSAQLCAMIHLTVPRSEIRTVMGPGLSEVKAVVKAQGIGSPGAWFTHHLKMDPATFDFEICVPLTAPVTPVGRVTPGETPVVRIARTIYHGPYEGLGAAWSEFHTWLETNGHATGPDIYERYLVGPESSPNPADWRTELIKPLVSQQV